MDKKLCNKLISNMSNELGYCINNKSWGMMWDRYVDDNKKEEKDHDRFRGDSISRGLTIMEASRLFAVQQIVKYSKGEKAPDPANYLHFRKSLYTAYAIYATYKEDIDKILSKYNLDDVITMDYAEMIK